MAAPTYGAEKKWGDCHSQCAHWLRNDVEFFTLRKIDTERYAGGEKTSSLLSTHYLSGHPDKIATEDIFRGNGFILP